MAKQHIPEIHWTVEVRGIKGKDRVLDVGFGPGVSIQLLALKAHRGYVAGVDISPWMVNAARRRNRSAVRRGLVDLKHGDAANLPFPERRFDKACSIHSIYFWPDPEKACLEIFRVLRPGGRVYITILPKATSNAELHEAPQECASFRAFSGMELADLLANLGFERVRCIDGADPDVPSKFCVAGERSA